jgi:hypothetical protein
MKLKLLLDSWFERLCSACVERCDLLFGAGVPVVCNTEYLREEASF